MEIKTVDSFSWNWKYKDVALEPVIGALIHGVKTQRVYKLLNSDKWVSREELRGAEIVNGVRVELPAPKLRRRKSIPRNGLLEYPRKNRPTWSLPRFNDNEARIAYLKDKRGFEVKTNTEEEELTFQAYRTYEKPLKELLKSLKTPKTRFEITRTAPVPPEIIPPTPIKPIAAPTITPKLITVAPMQPRRLGSYHYSFEGGHGHVVSYGVRRG